MFPRNSKSEKTNTTRELHDIDDQKVNTIEAAMQSIIFITIVILFECS